MGGFRIDESEAKYRAYQAAGGLNNGCRLCEAPTTQTFTFWRIIPNKFPYDKISVVHDMIVPIQHLDEDHVTPEAWREYQEIKRGPINEKYDYIVEPVVKHRTIPAHFHTHLLVAK